MGFDQSASAGAQPVVRFHRNSATEGSDTVQAWHEIHAVLPNAVSLAGWDYKTLVATGAEANSCRQAPAVPRLEVHDAARPYRFESDEAACLRTDLALAAHEGAYPTAEGIPITSRAVWSWRMDRNRQTSRGL